MRTIETCFSPPLFQHLLTKENYAVVIVDILRFSTAVCTAFQNGATEIIPLAEIVQTKAYRSKGYLIAGERDGIVIEGADFGNSPFNFTQENVKGKKLVITTTNGTQTIQSAKASDTVVLGAFSNISVLADWLAKRDQNVVIFCAGWKNKFNLEDTLLAGALAQRLLAMDFCTVCDSTAAAIDLWNVAKKDILAYIGKAAHCKRLQRLGLDDVLEYCFTADTANVIPFLKDDAFVDILKEH